MREADKLRKKQLANVAPQQEESPSLDNGKPRAEGRWLPWLLLAASWLGFAGYVLSGVGQ
ncbi:DUF2956 family protein [Agarivorans sp. QJM3NY_33]